MDAGVGVVCCGSTSFSTRGYDRFPLPDADVAVVSTGGRSRKSPAAAAVWTQLWRKTKKEKIKRIFNCSSSKRMGFGYDIYSYAQNFDEDLKWDIDSDEFSRSFSARFAVPSRIFDKNIELVVSVEGKYYYVPSSKPMTIIFRLLCNGQSVFIAINVICVHIVTVTLYKGII